MLTNFAACEFLATLYISNKPLLSDVHLVFQLQSVPPDKCHCKRNLTVPLIVCFRVTNKIPARNKKFELMLTKRAKDYSSSCLQTVSLSPAISSQFILGWCACSRKSIKPLILEVWGLSKASVLIQLKSSTLVLVVIGSMPMPICNRFHERLANNGKITTFTGVPLFDALVRGFPWT